MIQDENRNKVVIEFIANGVIVYLPIRNVTTDEYDKSMVRREAMLQSLFDGELETSDPTLRKIQGGALDFSDVPDEKKYRKMTISEISDNLIYQFKTLPEALKFIEEEFTNPQPDHANN